MLFFESRHREKPNFTASFSLTSVWLTPLTSPESPTSPKVMVFLGMGLLRKLEAVVEMIPRSIAGSSIFIPPATFKNMSLSERATPPLLAKTAARRLTLFGSTPMVVLRGMARELVQTRACISTSKGLEPSIQEITTEPLTSMALSSKKILDGLPTSSNPLSLISNTPISLVGPYLFFTALRILYIWDPSPSK
ncbi:hypothetical protein ES703_104557 [subsurface metagenome]